MSHLRRVVYVFSSIIAILIFIVMITEMFAPVFDVAEAHNLGPFRPAYDMIKTVTLWMMVPIFGLSVIAYLVFGPAQDELQKDKRRRQL